MLRYPFIIGFTLLLSACMTTNVELPVTQFPVPLMEKLPVRMGFYLSEELLTYQFREDLGQNGTFEIEIGEAQPTMFQNLLTGMFAQAIRVDSTAVPAGLVDAVLVPSIAEMQFSTPQQTRTDYFEVWVRYQFQLYGTDGTLIGDWPLTAYGKANTQNYMLSTTAPTLRLAAFNACRDAMAFFTVQFRTVPVVQQWLKATLQPATPVSAGNSGS
jgi:hypothetical protein